MISGLVFSKNRPMQLDLLLRSIKKNAKYIGPISVLYLAYNSDFQSGYHRLKEEYNWVSWFEQENLEKQIYNFVANANKYLVFMTDDSILYRYSELTYDKIDWVFHKKECKSLILRVGLNIKYQNHWDKRNILPKIDVLDEYKDLVYYDAKQYDKNNDLGRAWQLDASIMPSSLYLQELNQDKSWKSHLIRSLDNLAGCGHKFDSCYTACFKDSVYLNCPINVQHKLKDGRIYADNHSKFHHYSVEELGELFLKGYRIDMSKINVENIDCGRKEFKLEFYRK